MQKNTAYCSLEPVYPRQAYLLFLFILHLDDLIGVIPLDFVYPTLDTASEGIRKTVKQFKKIDNTITVSEECLLIPIIFKSKYPLRKEFWTKSSIPYNSNLRTKTFAPVLEHSEFYSLLVTPFTFDDNNSSWYFNAALPLINNYNTLLIEQFMYKSDHIVEPRARNAAIYTLTKKVRFNWQTKKIKPFDSTIKKILQTSN